LSAGAPLCGDLVRPKSPRRRASPRELRLAFWPPWDHSSKSGASECARRSTRRC
jgi:hypothetical protein